MAFSAGSSAEGLDSGGRKQVSYRRTASAATETRLALLREQLLATCSLAWANPSFEWELEAWILK